MAWSANGESLACGCLEGDADLHLKLYDFQAPAAYTLRASLPVARSFANDGDDDDGGHGGSESDDDPEGGDDEDDEISAARFSSIVWQGEQVYCAIVLNDSSIRVSCVAIVRLRLETLTHTIH